jgi:hypothetical protein
MIEAMRSMARRCPRTARRAPSSPKREMSCAKRASSTSVRCAVVLLVSPFPTRRDSTSATRKPARLHIQAAVTPVIPAPMMATSTATWPSNGRKL